MGLSSRELLLILRARDEASRVVRSFAGEFAAVDAAAQKAARNQISAGSALVSVGVGIGAVGAASLAWMKDATDSAVEFNKQVAYTSTQLDNVAGSQKDLADIIKSTGRDIAVPIEQLHQGLYDIFSSMNVTVPQAKTLLRTFAKEAVAGQVELKEAARSTIGILNAFHLSVDEVTRVQDVQFQLVRKGVGTYEEFARVMGRATPSAARAGQSVEVLAGMLAYLTRNGLSAAMAAASAGRAFDAFSHPSTVKRLQAMGIEVTNAEGGFRKFTDVVADLQAALADMTAPERAAALKELFKGSGGTIQARRFYDMVLKDKASVDQFVALVGDMENASGAFEGAYNTMANTTASKTQVIKNQYELLKVEVGNALIPVLSQLMTIVSGVLQWWNSLDEGLRKQIIIWVAIGSVIAVAVGIITAMAGAFLMLAGAAAMMGISLGALLGIFAAIAVGIAAIVAAVILLVKNWDTVTKALAAAWQWLKSVLEPIYDWLFDVIIGRLIRLWQRVSADIIEAVKSVGEWVVEIWTRIANWTEKSWNGIWEVIRPFIDWFKGVWPFISIIIGAALRWIADTFADAWTVIVGVLKGAWIFISNIISAIINIIMGIIDIIVGVFTLNWEQAWNGIMELVYAFMDIIRGVFVGGWEIIKGIFVGAWDFIVTTISNAITIILYTIRVVLDGIGRLWNQFWNWFWALVEGILETAKGGIKGFLEGIQTAFRIGLGMVGDIWEGIQDVFATPVNFVIGIVYTKGIKWLWDHVANFLGLGQLPSIKQLDHGVHFAHGGPVYGPGGPRDDRIPAWLSNGEYVMPADKTRRYRPLLDAMRAGYDAIPGFADGGVIGEVINWVGNVGKDVVDWLTHPIESVVKGVGSAAKVVSDVATVPFKLIGSVGTKLWDMIKADQSNPNSITQKMLDDALHHDTRGPMLNLMKRWANQQKGKLYQWGAVGPYNYDCSGLVGNLWAMAMGKPMYRRYFTTESNFPSLGFTPGPGMFTIYLGPGHMAANVDGLHAEAYGGNGTVLAIGHVGTPLSYYNRTYNLFKDGGFIDLKNNRELRNASWLQRGWPEPTLFDGGGVWRHGTLGLNMSGRDELVLDPDSTQSLLSGGGRRGDTYQNINIYTQEIDPRKHAADLGWEITYGRVV